MINKKLFLIPLMMCLIASCDSNQEKTKTDTDTETKIDSNIETIDITEAKTGEVSNTYENATYIKLDTDKATIKNTAIEETDYTWHVDPTVSHTDVKNAPAEYYSGTKYSGDSSIYIDHDLAYFPEISTSKFKLVNYDGEQEYAYYYEDGTNNDFIFATLPKLGNSIPTQMMFSEEKALQNKVLHITEPGDYVLEGSWDGQIAIDLDDEDAFTNENAKVNLILNGTDINCSVAPAVVFYNAYECDNTWESQETHNTNIDTKNAGANVIIADESENIVTGKNIYRMLKTKYKDEEVTSGVQTQKKQRKIDAAFYSCVTMNINGDSKNTGYLEINSSFEGLDSELHLAYNGANTIINSQDDGINVNEDNVSVFFMNDGNLTINAALGEEGDGIDSNGFVVINGGTLKVNNIKSPDSSIDSEDGVTLNGGTIIIDGTELNYTKGSTLNEVNGTNGGGMGGQGGPGGQGQGGPGGDQGEKPGNPGDMNVPGQGEQQNPGFDFNNTDFDLASFKEEVANLPDDATLEDVLKLLGLNNIPNN